MLKENLLAPLKSLVDRYRRHRFDSRTYWETRYARGGDSGIGSHGGLARYKAEVLNAFVAREGVRSVIEFGCGNGDQLQLYEFPGYVGLDVSETALRRCQARFGDDPTKRFLLYGGGTRLPESLQSADLTLSIDVLYHLVEEEVLESYIRDLFGYSHGHVVIYSTNFDRTYRSPHQVDREFTSYIGGLIDDFELIETIENPHKGPETMADFFVYRKCA